MTERSHVQSLLHNKTQILSSKNFAGSFPEGVSLNPLVQQTQNRQVIISFGRRNFTPLLADSGTCWVDHTKSCPGYGKGCCQEPTPKPKDKKTQ